MERIIKEKISADHLLYVSLKYTKTCDVIINLLLRWKIMIEMAMDFLVEKSKKQKKWKPVPDAPRAKLVQLKKIYENDSFIAVLDIKPASKGHVLLFPKKHYQLLAQMSEEEVNSLFTLANKLSAIVFECMKAEGTNIFTANGNAAGQMIPHVVVHIIPRWKDDKISFAWEGAKVDEKEMNDIQMNISKLVQEQLKEKVQRIEAVKSDDSFEEEERIP